MKIAHQLLIISLLSLSAFARADTNSSVTQDIKISKLPDIKLDVATLPKSVHLNQKVKNNDKDIGNVQKILKDKYGSLYIVHFDNLYDGIYYNGTLLSQISNNPGTVSVLHTFKINDKPVYLISANSGGSGADDYCDKHLLQINSPTNITISPEFCIEDATQKSKIINRITNKSIELKVFDGRQYVESGVYAISFDGRNFIKMGYKPDSYYINQLSLILTPESILQTADKDGCLTDGNISNTGACRYGNYYCAEFNLIKNHKNIVKDKDYNILSTTCQGNNTQMSDFDR